VVVVRRPPAERDHGLVEGRLARDDLLDVAHLALARRRRDARDDEAGDRPLAERHDDLRADRTGAPRGADRGT
jgi:hypothetical protein